VSQQSDREAEVAALKKQRDLLKKMLDQQKMVSSHCAVDGHCAEDFVLVFDWI